MKGSHLEARSLRRRVHVQGPKGKCNGGQKSMDNWDLKKIQKRTEVESWTGEAVGGGVLGSGAKNQAGKTGLQISGTTQRHHYSSEPSNFIFFFGSNDHTPPCPGLHNGHGMRALVTFITLPMKYLRGFCVWISVSRRSWTVYRIEPTFVMTKPWIWAPVVFCNAILSTCCIPWCFSPGFSEVLDALLVCNLHSSSHCRLGPRNTYKESF